MDKPLTLEEKQQLKEYIYKLTPEDLFTVYKIVNKGKKDLEEYKELRFNLGTMNVR